MPPRSHVPVALTRSTHLLGCGPWWPGWTNLPREARGALKRRGVLSEGGHRGGRAQTRTSCHLQTHFTGLLRGCCLHTLSHRTCLRPPGRNPHPQLPPQPHGDTGTQPGLSINSWGHPAVPEHRSPQPRQDILTGGPGKPGWPWKPCGETRAEPDPDGHILPHGGPGDPCPHRPLGDAHLVPLLAGAAREPALTPRSLRREGVRWVGRTLQHPWPPQPSPLPSPQPPGSRSGWAPTAGPVGPGRPSKPGGPWEGEEQGQMNVAWKDLSPSAHGEGGTWESPQPLCPWSTAPRDSPVPPSPQGGPGSLAHL